MFLFFHDRYSSLNEIKCVKNSDSASSINANTCYENLTSDQC